MNEDNEYSDQELKSREYQSLTSRFSLYVESKGINTH
jgi:hypothetical protein